jgi:hypothetical protein
LTFSPFRAAARADFSASSTGAVALVDVPEYFFVVLMRIDSKPDRAAVAVPALP